MPDWELAWNRERDRLGRERLERLDAQLGIPTTRHAHWSDVNPGLKEAILRDLMPGFKAGYETRVEEEERGDG